MNMPENDLQEAMLVGGKASVLYQALFTVKFKGSSILALLRVPHNLPSLSLSLSLPMWGREAIPQLSASSMFSTTSKDGRNQQFFKTNLVTSRKGGE